MDAQYPSLIVGKRFAAIIVAAGTGSRMGGDIPKQFMDLDDKPVIAYSIDAFASDPRFSHLVVVCSPQWRQFVETLPLRSGIHLMVTEGGQTRRESVAAGIRALGTAIVEFEAIFVHDAARPGLTQAIIDSLAYALEDSEAVVPALSVVDSMAMTESGRLTDSLNRERMARIQTPQAFRTETLIQAHARWTGHDEPTDDARMVQAIGARVAVVAGEERLLKLTHPHDFALFRALHESIGRAPIMRIGLGYDVHQLVAGEELWLCGVQIDHTHGLSGHSDADVALHAVTDAVLGAIGAGDIGQHFPPSDPQWRGARSDQFLAHAMKLASDAGYTLGNVDLTIICERPKIGPHRDTMRAKLALIMNVMIEQVSVKATTTEKLGFTGREEGIAAQAIVLLHSK